MKIDSFTKAYDGVKVLEMPELELQPGIIYAVAGPNGCGKTTFSKVVAGIVKADCKMPVTAGVKVGYMPQKSYGFSMNVLKNLMLNSDKKASSAEDANKTRNVSGTIPENPEERAAYLAKALKIDRYLKKSGHKLSGGETAKLALARILMKKYDVVIFDEPTAAMDIESTVLAEDLIRAYVAETRAVGLFITHSLHEAVRVGDEMIFINEGRLVEMGPIDRVVNDPENPETKKFIDFFASGNRDKNI